MNIANSYTPNFIDSLCDVVPNKKRTKKHFLSLQKALQEAPKECTPFKGKIIQHLQIHALGNSDANLRLLAHCFAKATILFRKGQNKSEGPVEGWKQGFKNQIIELEKNLNELYDIAGVNATNVVGYEVTDLDDNLKSDEKLSETQSNYQSIVNSYLLKVKWSAHCLCALISIKTDFDIPIPIQVLLKIALKIGSLRWKDYKKKPNTLLRTYIYSLTPDLLDISLMLFHSIVTVLNTNIIPFIQFINQTISSMLEWTRTSNLVKHDELVYYSIRSKLFKIISFTIEQLSLNINLEPHSLKILLENEILDNLDLSTNCENDILEEFSDISFMKNKNIIDVLYCLENLLIVYANLLEPGIEGKIKNYIIQTCIKIYRDFESNLINLQCRKQLLRLVEVIANQPYATSTTEISHHIFELVERIESDRDMKAIARKCLKLGLAHRPTIVSHHDVYNIYNCPMLTHTDATPVGQSTEEITKDAQQREQQPQENEDNQQPLEQQQIEEPQLQKEQRQVEDVQPQKQQENSDNKQQQQEQHEDGGQPKQQQGNCTNNVVDDDDDGQISFYMSHFVEKQSNPSI